MGMRGPKPKPTAIRVFEGNPGNIPLNENEPMPQKCESLEPDEWLSDDCEYMIGEKFPLSAVAKKIWNNLAPELERLGVLTQIDKTALTRYCDTLARWLKTKAFLDRHGETFPVYGGQFEPMYKDGSPVLLPDGKVKHEFKKYLKQMRTFPQVQMYIKYAEQLKYYEGEFGLAPACRTRIQAIVQSPFGKPEEDDFDYASKNRIRAVK